MKAEFHPDAAQELAAAVQMYESSLTGLGADLRVEVMRITSLLCGTPRIGEPLDQRHRRFPLRRFPYGLVFRLDGELLRIIAVAHRRQRPGYWSKRA